MLKLKKQMGYVVESYWTQADVDEMRKTFQEDLANLETFEFLNEEQKFNLNYQIRQALGKLKTGWQWETSKLALSEAKTMVRRFKVDSDRAYRICEAEIQYDIESGFIVNAQKYSIERIVYEETVPAC